MSATEKTEPEGEKVFVNLRSTTNAGEAREETRDGRKVYVVPAKTMRDNCVLNGVLYPAEELRDSYRTLNKTFAPVGHPTTEEGHFLSAQSPEGAAKAWRGMHCENVRRVPDSDNPEVSRIHHDFVIDIERAMESDDGKWLVNKVKKGEQIPTSTGLTCIMESADGVMNGKPYKAVARWIYFDHDAALRNEKPASPISEGTGMFVNHLGETEERRRIIVHMDDRGNEGLPIPIPKEVTNENLIGLLTKALGLANLANQSGESAPKTEDDMSETAKNDSGVSSEDFAKLNSKVEEMQNSVATKEDVAEIVANEIAKARDGEKRDETINALVEAKVFANAEECKEVPTAALINMKSALNGEAKSEGEDAEATNAEEDEDKEVAKNARDFKANKNSDGKRESKSNETQAERAELNRTVAFLNGEDTKEAA